ncbi:MAG: flagellar FlbD family protein [Ignavibacteriae bacterium]|nr:flagellar FlbD family protein [Ignavibacteriota bacterium]
MITLTRIDTTSITVNADEIETVESYHDTTITLRSGRRIIVQEAAPVIIQMVIAYRRECNSPLPGIIQKPD